MQVYPDPAKTATEPEHLVESIETPDSSPSVAESSGRTKPVRSVGGGRQVGMFDAPRRTPGKPARRRQVGFIDKDPREIFIGEMQLDDYLRMMGMEWVLTIRKLLRELSWEEFEARYQLTGRSPYAPVAVMGLVLYGTMSGISSLRGLEDLARKDLGAMWMTGGICPDHACLGRFINRHGETVNTSFFEDLTRRIVKRLGSNTKVLAGDGTIIEAASSRYQIIKREAAKEAAKASREEAARWPDDDELKAQAERAGAVADAVEARAEARRRNGDNAATTRGTRTEPEAPVLKTKRGQYAPAYVPSTMANEDRLIVAQHVETTNELAAVAPLLDQADRVGGGTKTLLLDGGYAKGPVLNIAVERDLDLLSPPSKTKKNDGETSQFTKQDFVYDDESDTYRCPAGQTLTLRGRRRDRRRKTASNHYAPPTEVCQGCPLMSRCIKGKSKRRRIYRHDTDEAMEALRLVMSQPNARAALAKRKVMVEPVYADLKGIQGLTRFRRFGLRGVRTEFAIHACAHNLRRLVALLAARFSRLLPIFLLLGALHNRPNPRFHRFGRRRSRFRFATQTY